MKRIIYCILILSGLCMAACGQKNNTREASQESDFEFVHLIPDSLQTPEQKKTHKLLLSIMAEHIVLKDNHFVLNISKKDFLKKGLSEEYYTLLEENVKSLNEFTDSNNLENDELKFKQSKDDTKEFLKNSLKK